jgi:DNA-binding NtrC family response regulator
LSSTCEASGEGGQYNGATLADLDNDGDLDILVTSSNGRNRLWRNDGNWRFTDVSGIVGFASGPFSYGSAAADFDNDGLLDLVIVNAEGLTYLRNVGDMQFIPTVVDGLTDVLDARSVAVADIDNDGDLDLFVTSKADFNEGVTDFSSRRSTCFVNKLDRHNSIRARLKGVYSNTVGIGGRIELRRQTASGSPGELAGMREIAASNGFRSQNSAAAHFGVDSAFRYTVRAVFPSGRIVEIRDVKAGDRLTIPESKGFVAAIHGFVQAAWRGFWSDATRRHVLPLVFVVPLLVWAIRAASQRLLWGPVWTIGLSVGLSAFYALLAAITQSSSWWMGVLVPSLAVSSLACFLVLVSFWSGPRQADRVAYRRQLAILTARSDLTNVLSAALEPNDLATQALHEFSELFPVEDAHLVMCAEGSDRVELIVPGETPPAGLEVGAVLPKAFCDILAKGAVVWEDTDDAPNSKPGFSAVWIPLQVRSVTVGAIVGYVAQRHLGKATAAEAAARSFAAFVGMSLYNAQLQQQAKRRDAEYRAWLTEQTSPPAVPRVHPAGAHRELMRRLATIRKNPPSEPGTYESLTGDSKAIEEVVLRLRQVAPTDTSVLLLGQSGTGKELAARAAHGQSKRKDGPFVAINCGAIPEGLLESELFGHVKGAFTGAHASRPGVFQRAHRGTIFLDEIAEMNPSAQIRLLRVLQDRTVTPVGGEAPVTVDVRVIAATHQDLSLAVSEGRFREDLYYRLNVFPIQLPTLGERMEDMPALVAALLYRIAKKIGTPLTSMTEDAIARLLSHTWRGNVRELENCLERTVLVAGGAIIATEHIQFDTVQPANERAARRPGEPTVGMKLMDVEQELIEETLRSCNYNVSEAARKLGISRDILRYRIKKHDIQRGHA